MDDIKNPPSPPFRHHGPGLASGDIAEDGITTLTPEIDIQSLLSGWQPLLRNLSSPEWI